VTFYSVLWSVPVSVYPGLHIVARSGNAGAGAIIRGPINQFLLLIPIESSPCINVKLPSRVSPAF
jgi:hypothetical protein